MCVRVSVGLSPEQHVAGVAGGDPVERVHVEVVVVAGGVLGANVGSGRQHGGVAAGGGGKKSQ